MMFSRVLLCVALFIGSQISLGEGTDSAEGNGTIGEPESIDDDSQIQSAETIEESDEYNVSVSLNTSGNASSEETTVVDEGSTGGNSGGDGGDGGENGDDSDQNENVNNGGDAGTNEGGDNGGDAGKNEGGDNGGDAGKNEGGDNGGDAGTNEGGDNGGDAGKNEGGDNGGDAGTNEGGDNGGDAGTNKGGDNGGDAGTNEGGDNGGNNGTNEVKEDEVIVEDQEDVDNNVNNGGDAETNEGGDNEGDAGKNEGEDNEGDAGTNEGGDNEGDAGKNEGGDNEGDAGKNEGGDNGGDAGKNEGGDNGGDAGTNEGGDNGGDAGTNEGGDNGGDAGTNEVTTVEETTVVKEGEIKDGGSKNESNIVQDDGSDGTKDEGVVLRRRKRHTKRTYVLSRDDHPMHVTLVMLDDEHSRVKRTSYNKSESTWPHQIPYVFESDFNENKKFQLQQVLEFFENRVCVEFKNEQDFDSSNPNWFKEHGYSTNAYISFRTKSGCAAVYGRGHDDTGSRTISPCNQLSSMMHEILHSMGGIHAQSYPYRERYLTLHENNIDPRDLYNYNKYSPNSEEVEYEEFDPTSLLMYSQMHFTLNGMTTFDYLRPEMSHLTGLASFNNILFEITKNYRCHEKYCKDEDSDCGPGYLGYVDKKCTCVCPDGLDPANKCKDVVNSAPPSAPWPETPFSLFKGDECPEGTEEGRIPITGRRRARLTKKKFSKLGKTVFFDVCTKKTENVDFGLLPMGSYCIGKVKDVPCASPFEEGQFSVKSRSARTPSGEVGDVTMSGRKVTIKLCCQKQGDLMFPMKMPTAKPFRLLLNGKHCQKVEGMFGFPSRVIMMAKASKSGAGPKMRVQRRGFMLTSCYYQPPKYGCSQEFLLDAKNPSATVSVPVVEGSREPDRRCFYYFQGPEHSRLRLTINEMKLDRNDKVLVKRFSLTANPFKIDPHQPPHQMISEKNKLMIEYWSFFETKSSFTGASFTVDLLSPEGLCYDAKTNGADYGGNKAISETYEECVPWEDATSCPDFPWTGTNGLKLLNSGNSCRNLDDNGLFQPWCYTFANGTMCTRRYCDACNEADPVDKLTDCENYISNNPNFCTDALGRFGCFKTCGMDTATYDKDSIKCSKPVIPSDFSAAGDLQDSYDVGAKVSVSCNGQDVEIECTTLGWTPFDDQCITSQCADASQLCQNALSKYPEFCTNDNSKTEAEKYCKKSCGLCNEASCSASSGASYSLVSPADGTVTTGQEVTYACNDGLYHISGDLQRACSVSGDLLGEEPVCGATPPPKDIDIDQIAEMNRWILPRRAYLMLGYGMDVPFDGKITRWYYYCRSSKPIILLVYRRTSNPKRFKRVGVNRATCVSRWPWSHEVPEADQISVKKGDLLGVYDARSSIMMRPCFRSREKPAMVAFQRFRRPRGLIRRRQSMFRRKTCAFLSIGARVEPN